MKSSIISLAKWLFAILYIVFIYIYLYKVVNLQLHYHVQQPAFLTTTDFFRQYLSIPGMPSEYIANFLAQFFFIKWLGPLVILSIGALVMWFCYSIFRTFKYTGSGYSGYIWMFLPFSFLIALFNNYYFPFVIAVQVLIHYIALWIFLFTIKKKLNSYVSYIVLALGVYYIAGSGSFMIFSTSSVIITFYLQRFKNGIIFLLTVLAISVSIPYIAYKFLFNITIKDACFLIAPYRPLILKYEAGKILYFFYFYLPAAIFLLSIVTIGISKWKQQKQALIIKQTGPDSLNDQPDLKTVNINSIWWYLKKWLPILISVFIIIGVTYISLYSTFNKHSRNIAQADYYCYHEKWDKVIDVAMSDEELVYDFNMNLYYNRAIDNNGHYIDMYFNYPQMSGSECLYPDRLKPANGTIICSDYYFDLGYISEAHHWAYETQTALPYSPRILKRLVIINLIFGNYKAAENLLTVLNTTFFCNDFVAQHMQYIKDTSLISSDKLILEKRAFLPKTKHIPTSIFDRFHTLINKNNRNKRAIEQLAMSYLLTNHLDSFVQYLPNVMKLQEVAPEIFEEARLIYLVMKEQHNLIESEISFKAQETFRGFNAIIDNYQGDNVAAKPVLNEFYGNSYLYYLMFNNPTVTKTELKVGNLDSY